jgi:hypothetical protein
MLGRISVTHRLRVAAWFMRLTANGAPSRMFSRDGSLERDLWNNLRESQVTPYSADSCGGGASHSECPGSKVLWGSDVTAAVNIPCLCRSGFVGRHSGVGHRCGPSVYTRRSAPG